MRSTTRGAVVALLVVVLLGACSGDGKSGAAASSSTSASSSSPGSSSSSSSEQPTSAASSTGDLCRLVTETEAESYVGAPLDKGSATESDTPLGTVGSCVYKVVEGGAATTIVNVIVAGTKVTADQFDSQLASDASDATPVSGVGEKALLIQPGILAVFDNGVALTVEIIAKSNPAATDVLVTAAKNALERL
jgi:hypothetical protein